MSQRVTWRFGARVVVMLVGLAALLAACAKDPVRVDRNRPPRTYLVSAPAESSTFSYRIHLYWRGEDPDGYVAGFQWAWDDSSVNAFRFTTKTDSIFELAVNDSATVAGGTSNLPPGTSKPHTFFIRAVDNLGKPDPVLTVFNRRIYLANTLKPTVQFTGAYPTGAPVDSLCNGQPFEVCWGGSDADGEVIGYKYSVGAFGSPIVRDSCVTFNDPSDPNSIALSSGLYTLTVQSVDNAYALSDPGQSTWLFIVNRDPETWFEDASGGRTTPGDGRAVGYYIAPYVGGQLVPPVIRQFAEGDTVPFRSTVWWKWNGEDNPCDIPNGVDAFSISLSQGSRNNGDPYIVGLIGEISPGVPFRSNDPNVLGPLGFSNLILDSLDAGNGMKMLCRTRDVAGRISGFQFSGTFEFNCNFPPRMTGLTVRDTCVIGTGANAGRTVKAKAFKWTADDYEDGFPPKVIFELDGGIERRELTLDQVGRDPADGLPIYVIEESIFRGFSPENPHFVDVFVRDRGDYPSPGKRRVDFDVDYASDACTP